MRSGFYDVRLSGIHLCSELHRTSPSSIQQTTIISADDFHSAMVPKAQISNSAASSPWALVIAALWVVGFLAVFFKQPLHEPELRRFDVWLMVADEMLGVSDVSSDESTPAVPSGIRFLSQRWSLFGWATLILGLAASYGLAVTQLIPVRIRLLRTECVVVTFGSGLAILSLVTLCAGLAGCLSVAAITFPSLLSLLIAALLRSRSSNPADECPSESGMVRSSSVLVGLVLLVIVPFSFYLLLGSVSPSADFDVREYHLQGPKEWFQQGRISFLRHNVYTSFPFLSEMLLLTGMIFVGDWWQGALVGQAVLACFQLLSAVAVFAIGRRWLSPSAAWLGVLIYLTTPWTLRISLIAYAEGSLTFYLIASTMVALWATIESINLRSLAILSGLLAGSAMASKYTGLVAVIIPVFAMLSWSLRRKKCASSDLLTTASPRSVYWPQLFRQTAWFGLGVLLIMAPWMLRNSLDTGNPVYPLGYSVFGGDEWSAELNARWKPAHAPTEHQLGQMPKHFMDAAVYNMWTSGLLFALAIPSLLLCSRSPAIRVLLSLIAWGFFTWWALTHRIDRFWIPTIPLLSIAAASCWMLSGSRVWRGFLSVVIAAVTAYNVYFCGLALVGFHVGLMDLEAARQLTIRSDIRMLNSTLSEDARVLMVGEAEVFDATFPLVYNTVFDDCIFEQWTSDPQDADQPVLHRRLLSGELIRKKLSEERITHVLVHWGEILRYRLPGSYDYTAFVQPTRFSLLVAQKVLQAPRSLLNRPLSSLSPAELTVIKSWPGFESLIDGQENFQIVQLFEVCRPPAAPKAN